MVETYPPTVVRRCARCGEPSVVVVRDWGTRVFFGLVDGQRSSRQDWRCQGCGAAFSLQPAALVRALLGTMLFSQLLILGGMLVGLGFVGLLESPAMGVFLLMLGGVLMALSVLGLVHFVSPWWHARRNPILPDAPAPLVRFTEAEPLRRCTRGAASPATAVVAHSTNYIPTGTETTHTCPSCRREFTVNSPGGLVFDSFAASLLTPLAVLVIVHPPGNKPIPDLGNLGLAVFLGLFALGAWGMLVSGVVAKLRHPVVRVGSR